MLVKDLVSKMHQQINEVIIFDKLSGVIVDVIDVTKANIAPMKYLKHNHGDLIVYEFSIYYDRKKGYFLRIITE